jgi:hypothetical protein
MAKYKLTRHFTSGRVFTSFREYDDDIFAIRTARLLAETFNKSGNPDESFLKLWKGDVLLKLYAITST